MLHSCALHSTNAAATSKASIYSVPANLWVVFNLLSFAKHSSMLKKFWRKCFEICKLGDYCGIDTLQTNKLLFYRLWILC